MICDQFADSFQVVSGPEDGTDFHVARTPVVLGSDPGCAISLRLDQLIRRYHARITVVPDGYRVRRNGDAPVYVNGKRTGAFRSRIMRHGDTLRIGQTELVLICVPEGLASRSHGLASESDFAWTARKSLRTASRAGSVLQRGLFRLLRHPFLLVLVISCAWMAWSWYRYHTLMPIVRTFQNLFSWARYYISLLFR